VAKDNDLHRVLDSGLVAIIRSPDAGVVADVAESLAAGGVDVLEVTFTVPRAQHVLEEVADRLGNRVLLGAGTVLDPETARIALLSGAEFIVSPGMNRQVIELCRRYDKLVMPGALTPTEVIAAWQAGADIVKIFPSDFTGPSYIKILHGPLPQVRLMPTGGVTLDNIAAYFSAGACALGVGSALVDSSLVKNRDLAKLESLARQFVERVRTARSQLQEATSSPS
jgi:2-dehydro-3-deoxyphosphogluconate aldolase/(4S)-4-hydroxy-2-oxoglutarate aldolase